MNQTIVDRLLPLVKAYALGRRHQKELRAKLRGKQCDQKTENAGLFCRLHWGALEGRYGGLRWCDNCKAREPIWREFADWRRTNHELLRRIEALGLKLSLPDIPAEPEAPKELLKLMDVDTEPTWQIPDDAGDPPHRL